MSKRRLIELASRACGVARRQGGVCWAGGFIAGVAVALYAGHGLGLHAQLSERPGCSIDNPIDIPRDLSGYSIKNPRIRVVHTVDTRWEGGSMYLQQVDPWLGYMWGKSLTQRNFRDRDGVYGDSGKIDGLLLADGATKMMDRGHTNSCGACHNNPYRDGGAGMTIAKNGGSGRNTPHLFGGGLVEMIGLQMRLMALAIADTNRDGWISFDEMKAARRCILSNLPAGIDGQQVSIDFGSFDDLDGDGYPDLNPIFYPIFVDKNGQRIASARSLRSPDVAGYTIEVQVFGFGHLYLPFRPPVSTTLRAFTATPFDIHSGLQAHDPTTYTNPRLDALALVSNAGAQQFVTAAGKDRGGVRAKTTTGWPGISLDDPDRDGYCEEISEGDLDVAEWYLLNHPAPGRGRITSDAIVGEKLFNIVGCASCHVADWHLHAHNPSAKDYTARFDGDRRFFDLQAAFNDNTMRMEGKLVSLGTKVGNRTIPRRDAATVRGIYSDFKYHDVGEEFYQMQFDGSIIKQWRTAPLWGVGTTAPYGHDGASLDLDCVIRRHGGEALYSKKSYLKLKDVEQKQLLCFLNSLVLYQTDTLPCDINGDGKIDEHFMVAGMDTGIECFNPEWLFKVPAKIEGPIRNVRGEPIVSRAIVNVRQAYGLDLHFLRDTDGDGFPDVIDPDPLKPGFRNGIR
jgi:hypothetical protein